MTEKHVLWFEKALSSFPNSGHIPATEGELNVKDLDTIKDAAWEARAKWYNIVLKLNIDPGTLDTIQENNDNIDDQFQAMLTTWLKVNPRPTWGALAVALRSRIVGYEQLAERCMLPAAKKRRFS